MSSYVEHRNTFDYQKQNMIIEHRPKAALLSSTEVTITISYHHLFPKIRHPQQISPIVLFETFSKVRHTQQVILKIM